MERTSAELLLVFFACLSGLAAAAVCEGYASPKQCLGPTGSGIWSDAGRCAWFGPAVGGICITTPEQLPPGRAAITSIDGPVAVPAAPALQAPAPEPATGRRLLAPAACADVPTPEGYTCAQQKAWGKCAAEWMLAGGWCAQTCGRCTAAQPGSSALPSPAAASQVELSPPAPALPSPPAPVSSPAATSPAPLPPSLPTDVVSVLVPPAAAAAEAADARAQQQNLGVLSQVAAGAQNAALDSTFCSLPPAGGSCQAHLPRWFFSRAAAKCQPFVYSGCGGNQNNFSGYDDCQAAAVLFCAVPPPAPPAPPVKQFWKDVTPAK